METIGLDLENLIFPGQLLNLSEEQLMLLEQTYNQLPYEVRKKINHDVEGVYDEIPKNVPGSRYGFAILYLTAEYIRLKQEKCQKQTREASA